MTRIALIEPIPIAYPDPNDCGTIRRTVLVRVETTDGVAGWGECSAVWPEACEAVATVISEGFLPLLKDKLAEDIDGNWTAMRRHVFWSCKLGFAKKGESNSSGDPETDLAFIRALRSALGDAAKILVDIGNGMRWDMAASISVGKQMPDYRIGWYEKPLYPTDDAGYRQMQAETTLTLASGEREFTEAGYRRQMEFIKAIDVYGVDPARVEGITGFRKDDALCTLHGKKINAHAWSTGITTAASAHSSLASQNPIIFEYKPFPVVVQDVIVAEKLWHKDGFAYPIHGHGHGHGHGLGIDVIEAEVRRLAA